MRGKEIYNRMILICPCLVTRRFPFFKDQKGEMNNLTYALAKARISDTSALDDPSA